MTKSSLQHINKIAPYVLWTLSFLIVVTMLAVVSTAVALKQVISQNISTAVQFSRIARVLIVPAQIASLQQSATITTLALINNSIIDIPILEKKFTQILAQNSGDTILDLTALAQLSTETEVQTLLKTLRIAQDSFLYPYTPAPLQNIVETGEVVFLDALTILEELKNKDQTIVIVFQNNNELRATGGFMGSYALVNIIQGQVKKPIIEDIFDADGQFDGFVAAPAGLNEYLSGGNGMRLPDANWHPDFTLSAQQILQFFAFGNKDNVTTLVAVTTDFAKEFLAILGPVELVDYNTIVTAENIDVVLRSRRDTFFAGSTQKKHLLSQLLVQLGLKVRSTTLDEKQALYETLVEQIAKQTMQAYSRNPTIDQLLHDYQLRLELNPEQTAENFLYIVESNVGINKANKGVQRSVELKNQNQETQVKIVYKNTNVSPTGSSLQELVQDNTGSKKTAEHMAYVNYQRVLAPADWKLTSVVYNDTKIEQLDIEELMVHGKKLQQIGFLITVLEEGKGELTVLFNTPEYSKITLFKQPGLPETTYTLSNNYGVITQELTTTAEVLLPQ